MNMSVHAVVAIAIAVLMMVAIYGLATGGLSEIEAAITGDESGNIQDEVQQPDGDTWSSPDEISKRFNSEKMVIQNG